MHFSHGTAVRSWDASPVPGLSLRPPAHTVPHRSWLLLPPRGQCRRRRGAQGGPCPQPSLMVLSRRRSGWAAYGLHLPGDCSDQEGILCKESSSTSSHRSVNTTELRFAPLLCWGQLLWVPAKTFHDMGLCGLPVSVSSQLRAPRPKSSDFLSLGQWDALQLTLGRFSAQGEGELRSPPNVSDPMQRYLLSAWSLRKGLSVCFCCISAHRRSMSVHILLLP